MNKYFRYAAVMIMITGCVSSFAQISLGVKGGINFNSFRESKVFKNYVDVVPGFNAGVFATYPTLNFLNARVELLYMQQGANLYDYRVMPELYRNKVVARIHALQIPVLLEFGLPSLKEDVLQPKLLLGGFYSHTLESNEHYVNEIKLSGIPAVEYKGRSDLDNQFESAQYGFIGALVAQLEMFGKPVSLEFRYQYNLSRANKPGTERDENLAKTTAYWGDKLFLHTLSINASVTLFNF